MNGKIAKRLRAGVVGTDTEYTRTYTKNTKQYAETDGTVSHYGYTAKLKKDTKRYHYKQAKKTYKT